MDQQDGFAASSYYSLANTAAPLAGADHTLPATARDAVPTNVELAAVADRAMPTTQPGTPTGIWNGFGTSQ